MGMPRGGSMFGCPDWSSFRAECENVSSEMLASVFPKGSRQGAFTGPFAPRLRGCLKRFACAKTRLLSEQLVKMYRARRCFQHSDGGGC
eukprot:5508812-Pyramimonas_sp.AAC.1